MKNNVLQKLFGNNIETQSKDVEKKLKDTLRNRWKKQSEASAVDFDKLYKQMVEEAVLVIKDKWQRDAEYGNEHKYPTGAVTLEANYAFFVTEDRKLYSSSLPTRNPKTGKSCFFSTFEFPSDDLITGYVAEVLENLPIGTEYKVHKRNDNVFGPITEWSFTITLNNLEEE